MGCCYSINTSDSKQHLNSKNTHQPLLRSPTPKSNAKHELNHRAPPSPSPSPLPVEEETVKEVLSETPISKPQVSILTVETKTQLPRIQHLKCPIFEKAEDQVSEEVSQITETCSIIESFSTIATTAASTVTTVTEMRDDEVTSKRSPREGTKKKPYQSQSNRSYGVDGNRIGGRERRPPKSPARTPDNPPEKRIAASSRTVRWREPGIVRRDSGESTGRRSRSPSSSRMSGSGNCRNQVKQPGMAGRRLPPVKGLERENGARILEENDVVGHEESFENPHVSMECFIFL